MRCTPPLAPSTTHEGACVPIWAADHPYNADHRRWNLAGYLAGGAAALTVAGLALALVDKVLWA